MQCGETGFRDENLAMVECVSGACWHNWLPFPKPPLTSSGVLALGPQTLRSLCWNSASLNWVSRKVYHVFVVVTDLELQLSIPFHYDCR